MERLDVRQFGVGYWLVATGSTLSYLLASIFATRFYLLSNDGQQLVMLLSVAGGFTMLAGLVFSIVGVCRGLIRRDANLAVGGLLGFFWMLWSISVLLTPG